MPFLPQNFARHLFGISDGKKINITTTVKSKVTVKWLALLSHNQKIVGSYFCPKTGHSDWYCSWFFSVPPGKFRDNILNYGASVYFHSLPNQLPINHPIVRGYIIWAADGVNNEKRNPGIACSFMMNMLNLVGICQLVQKLLGG
jgi:hypothetical protein